MSSYRIYDTFSPSLSCEKNDSFTVNESDKGNGALNYPVALLSGDEAVLAGASHSSENSNHYLINGLEYWTMTPGRDNTSGGTRNSRIYSTGNIYEGVRVDVQFGVRPVISITHESMIYSGDGTANNPYIIATN